MGKKYLIGIDHRTDTSGLFVIDAENGERITVSVFNCSDSGFTNGLYSYPAKNQLRTYTLDCPGYLDANQLNQGTIDVLSPQWFQKSEFPEYVITNTGELNSIINDIGTELKPYGLYKVIGVYKHLSGERKTKQINSNIHN